MPQGSSPLMTHYLHVGKRLCWTVWFWTLSERRMQVITYHYKSTGCCLSCLDRITGCVNCPVCETCWGRDRFPGVLLCLQWLTRESMRLSYARVDRHKLHLINSSVSVVLFRNIPLWCAGQKLPQSEEGLLGHQSFTLWDFWSGLWRHFVQMGQLAESDYDSPAGLQDCPNLHGRKRKIDLVSEYFHHNVTW